MVLALLAGKLPPHQQKKALTYGLVGAIGFRLIALFFVTHLMRWVWVKFVGGGYLLYVALSHFLSKKPAEEESSARKISSNFWKAVVVIELTDIAFAVDSILAAVAISKKLWVVFTGGVIGLILMRFAASLFIKLLKKFPAFETSAYLLVFIIGAKLILDGLHLPGVNFHSASSPATWIFWIAMAIAIGLGFRKVKGPTHDQK